HYIYILFLSVFILSHVPNLFVDISLRNPGIKRIGLFKSLARIALSIRCYRCSPVPRNNYAENYTVRPCSQFDYSDKYIIDCPYSTMCMKKIYSVNLTGNFTNGTHRDCAYQKYEYQKYVNGRWELAVAINEESLAEGCLMTDGKGFKISTASYCYCKGDLCNGVVTIGGSILSAISVIISMFYF
ncbi:hypothetical protein AMK59_2275, partial [Oryctes borbonicus]